MATDLRSSKSLRDGSSSSSWGYDPALPTPRMAPPATFSFVRKTDAMTLALRSLPHDTVGSVLEQLKISGCGHDLRLIHEDRQLLPEATFAKLHIPQDATFHLASCLRSTTHHRAWQIASQIAAAATYAASGARDAWAAFCLEELVQEFLFSAKNLYLQTVHAKKQVAEYMDIFLQAGAAVSLVHLYVSRSRLYYMHAQQAIICFAVQDSMYMPREVLIWAAPVLMELCRWLALCAGKTDSLYLGCRCALATVLSLPDWVPPPSQQLSPTAVIKQVLPFAREMARVVMDEMAADCSTVQVKSRVQFTRFCATLRREVLTWIRHGGQMPRHYYEGEPNHSSMWILELHGLLNEMLGSVGESLTKFDTDLSRSPSWRKGIPERKPRWASTPHVLTVMTELDLFSEIYEGIAHSLKNLLVAHKASINALAQSAKRHDNINWVMKHLHLLEFEARNNLAMSMFPDRKNGYEDMYLISIDRSRLLDESFAYIMNEEPTKLRGNLFVEFNNELATGPGVLREWFSLVCHELFSPHSALFSPCPHDRHRFYLKPTSAVGPLHLKYLVFAGRMIGLALMNKIQIGIVFDRTLFSLLAGRNLSLEDIADADPTLYASCIQILEMDPGLLDSDLLGLTFVREVEVFGSRKVIELVQGGKDVAVNSINRDCYIKLLIHSCFVNSTSVQFSHFAKGFSDMLFEPALLRNFFQTLHLEDLDRMLGGSNSTVDVKDWKLHTEYIDYREKDRQIIWFWEAVDAMPVEQQRRLLFFWTSMKYLPSDGFRGLDPKPSISRKPVSLDHLPTSYTCFYRLSLPAYTSRDMLRGRLQMITKEDVSCSFGAR